MRFAPSTYYGIASRKPSDRARRDEVLKTEIARVSDDNFGICGVVKIDKQLNREGVSVANCTVRRLMRDLGLFGVRRGRQF